MRFMLLMYRDEKWWDAKPEEERGAIRQQAVDVAEALRKRGIFLAGDPLLPTHTATTVRMRNGKTVTTDGPFAETKEQLGGYSIVDVADLDAALAIATEHPLVRVGGHSIEIRPIRELSPPR
ncbi:MAG TPA: YciI family protein [Methylomirabilota bacterium]|nr:YciI family protein [Methylomirabilota bacterium]